MSKQHPLQYSKSDVENIKEKIESIIHNAKDALRTPQKISLYIKVFFKETIPEIINIQEKIIEMITTKELLFELHGIFLQCKKEVSSYIYDLQKLFYSEQLKTMNTFLMGTLFKCGSLIALFPIINWSITKNCKKPDIIQSSMKEFVNMLEHFGQKLNSCILTKLPRDEQFNSIWDGLYAFNFDEILPDLHNGLESILSTITDDSHASIQNIELKMQMMREFKSKLGVNICRRLMYIIKKVPDMLSSIIIDPHSQFIKMELVVTVFIFCTSNLSIGKEIYSCCEIEKVLFHLSDILIQIINGPDILESNLVYIKNEHEMILKEKESDILNTIISAFAASRAARVALHAAYSIQSVVSEAISVAAALQLQDEIKKAAIIGAVNVAKAASKFATKCVKNVNKKINIVILRNKASLDAARIAMFAVSSTNKTILNMQKNIDVLIIKKSKEQYDNKKAVYKSICDKERVRKIEASRKERENQMNAALASDTAVKVAVHSITFIVNKAIAIADKLSLQNEMKKSATMIAAKVASKYANKCVENANRKIKNLFLMKEASSNAARIARFAAVSTVPIISNMNKLIDELVITNITKKNSLIPESTESLIPESIESLIPESIEKNKEQCDNKSLYNKVKQQELQLQKQSEQIELLTNQLGYVMNCLHNHQFQQQQFQQQQFQQQQFQQQQFQQQQFNF